MEVADGSVVRIAKVETLVSTAIVYEVESTIPNDEVSYVPELATNFLSVSCIQQK